MSHPLNEASRVAKERHTHRLSASLHSRVYEVHILLTMRPNDFVLPGGNVFTRIT